VQSQPRDYTGLFFFLLCSVFPFLHQLVKLVVHFRFGIPRFELFHAVPYEWFIPTLGNAKAQRIVEYVQVEFCVPFPVVCESKKEVKQSVPM